MNLFTIPPQDQSLAFLIQIFGTVGGVLPAAQGGPLLLGTLFKTFNTVMLTLGAFLIVYTTVVGLLATAHEGEFMGKKWSGLWVPIRSLIGITALFPTASGYSILQVIIMWVIIQGIGAADMVWTTALNYAEITGSPLSQPSFPATGIESKMNILFQGLSCQANALLKSRYGDTNIHYCAAAKGTKFCSTEGGDLLNVAAQSTDEGAYLVYPMGPEGACGTVSYCNPTPFCNKGTQGTLQEQIQCVACKAQKQALIQIVPILGAVATKFADVDSQYIDFNAHSVQKVPDWVQSFCNSKNIKECCVWKPGRVAFMVMDVPCPAKDTFDQYPVNNTTGGPPDTSNPSENAVKKLYFPFALQNYLNGLNFTNAAVGYYMSAVSGALATFMQTVPEKGLSDWRKEAQQNGWMVAGTFYNKMADSQTKALEGARPSFEVLVNVGTGNVMAKYRNDITGATYLSQQFAESGAATSSPAMNVLSNELRGAATDVFQNWQKSLSTQSGSHPNPLAQLHEFGRRLLIVAEALYPVLLVAAVAIGIAKMSFIGLGTGVIEPLSWVSYLLMFGFLPMAFFFMGFCITFGGLLAVYVPLIPYIVFTMSVLGWFISTIEAMVASPLMALGILSPGGHHEILGKAEPALMLLLGVLLRPTLMIFGLMAAMLLSYGALLFLNNTFARVIGDISTAPSIIELILFCTVYTFIIISILNKCFSLIHLIPERVMTWIGGQAVSYGEGEGVGEVKRGAESVGGAVSGGYKGAGAAGEGAGKRGEKVRKKKAAGGGGGGRGGGPPGS